MDRQTEITTPGALLNEKGDLARPGFSRALVQEYRRADVKVSPLRIKEWDYYLVNNGKFALALTVADNGYMGLDSVSLLDLEEGWEITKSPMTVLPLGRTGLPESSARGVTSLTGRGFRLLFRAEKDHPRGEQARSHGVHEQIRRERPLRARRAHRMSGGLARYRHAL